MIIGLFLEKLLLNSFKSQSILKSMPMPMPMSKRSMLLSLIVLTLIVLSFMGCASSKEKIAQKRIIDNRHLLGFQIQEILDQDSISKGRFDSRLLPDTTFVTPIVSVLYLIDDQNTVSDIRIYYATNTIYAQDAMNHLKTTPKRDQTPGWHYQQWTFEVPKF